METLRNYLETMFANLPNTADVNRAKQELWTMMEDKYNELISEGKTENEAVGTVISEFGNLEEIAEAIGLQQVIETYDAPDIRMLSLQEAKDFVFDTARRQFMIAIGVLLFIISPIGPILGSAFSGIGILHIGSLMEAIGVIFMFLAVAIGVGIIIISSLPLKEWKFMQETACGIDYATADFIAMEKKNNETEKNLMLAVGIIFCIVSIIPVAFFGMVNFLPFLTEAVGPSLLFLISGIGVMLIITSVGKDKAYDRLLKLNDEKTVAGNYESTRNSVVRYANENVGFLMANYWRIITCVYLIWSFLSFQWYRTWIIFPIAGIVHSFLKKSYTSKDGENK